MSTAMDPDSTPEQVGEAAVHLYGIPLGAGDHVVRHAGRSKWFRYEVRCWCDGVIPDASAAVDGPRQIPSDRHRAGQILDLAPSFPTHTWGRDELRTGDMGNSNPLIAWLLAVSGHDLSGISPPGNGRAPGWAAGLNRSP